MQGEIYELLYTLYIHLFHLLSLILLFRFNMIGKLVCKQMSEDCITVLSDKLCLQQ